MTVLCILTCFNRKCKTENCIRKLVQHNPNVRFTFIVVDDNSSDGTKIMLEQIKNEYDVHTIDGSGNLFYSGGMRMGMQYAIDNYLNYDYLLMVNDDVDFLPSSIETMIEQSQEQKRAVVIGATKNTSGHLSYSAIKYSKGYKYRHLQIDEWQQEADTFNANCVLIPYNYFVSVGPIDNYYTHSLGDFDYGLELKRHGYKMYVSRNYCGICNQNSFEGTWLDTKLSLKTRLTIKESAKGVPVRQWFYFLKKNFGLGYALIGSITPYLRILIHK